MSWYNNSNNAAFLAPKCTAASGGKYKIAISSLPNDASSQREQLLRRLAANDKSIDVMSVDPPFMAEYANAGFLRPFSQDETTEFSEGVLKGPLAQSVFRDTMYSAPFYGNSQLLWYKKSAIAKTGVDPSKGPVTWDQLITGASKANMTIGAQGRLNESLMVWINALVASDGGSILDPSSEGAKAKDVKNDLNSPAGQAAAKIMGDLANSKAAPPALSTAGEEDSRAAFQASNGAFMVNWPYVWAAFDSAIAAGTLPKNFKDDVGWARYPAVTAGKASAPPLGGIGLSISNFSTHKDLAVDAVRCLRSLENQREYMLKSGDPGDAGALYDDPAIRKQFPMADLIRTSMNEAVPRPITPYYGDVTASVQRGYHPPNSDNAQTTPQKAASLLSGVLSNKRLL